MPNASTFPFVGMSLTLNSGDTIQVSPTDLKAGLQYSPTPGLAPLVERLRRMQVIEHSPGAAADGLLLSITNGSQDGLAKAFDMFLDESSSILVETPTYSGVLAYLEPIGCNLVSVPIDDKGLRADALAAVLDSWDVAKRGAKPKVWPWFGVTHSCMHSSDHDHATLHRSCTRCPLAPIPQGAARTWSARRRCMRLPARTT